MQSKLRNPERKQRPMKPSKEKRLFRFRCVSNSGLTEKYKNYLKTIDKNPESGYFRVEFNKAIYYFLKK